MRERLEPVRLADLRAGDEVVRTIVTRGTKTADGYDESMSYDKFHRDVTWQRVVRDPELPTLPGAVIRCQVLDYPDIRVAESIPCGGGDAAWLIAGRMSILQPAHITRVIDVLDPGREPDAPSDTSEGAPR